MNQNPNYQQQYQPPPPQHQYNDIESQIKAILSSTKGWIMFFGIMNIIMAATVTIMTFGLGIVAAWIPLVLGIILIGAANKIKNYLLLGNPVSLVEYHRKMKSFFITVGVITIISLVLNIIFMIVAAVTGNMVFNGNFNFPLGG